MFCSKISTSSTRLLPHKLPFTVHMYYHSHKFPLSHIENSTLPVTSFILAGHLEYEITRLFGSIPVDTVEGAKYRWVSPDI